MSKLVPLKTNYGTEVLVSALKLSYISNILKIVKDIKCIDKVYIFGSSVREDCQDASDVDIAVVGDFINKYDWLHSKDADVLYNSLLDFDDNQEYDIIYRYKEDKDDFYNMFEKGVLLYKREESI